MYIRSKIVLVVIPLIATPLLITGLLSYYAARNGITTIAVGFLRFKAEQLRDYAESQWTILSKNNLEGDEKFLEAAKAAVSSYSRSLVRSDTELVLALDGEGGIASTSSQVDLGDSEMQALLTMRDLGAEGWQQVTLGGADRVAYAIRFQPFGWYILVTERRDSFYMVTTQILRQVALVLSISSVVAILLLFLFSYFLIKPLGSVVQAMKEIISKSDLSRRVTVMYRDETGELGQAFNLMTSELETAYKQIKSFALKAVIAQHKEQKVRNIFQMYVPKEVIDRFFQDPTSMLVGESRVLAVLFSDIRSFTTLSEHMSPDQVVDSLNSYFGRMVDIIMGRQGIVDKYMGDCIMAFFGAPVRHDDDAYQAVLSALEMQEALKDFNASQKLLNRPEFRIGIGINYGDVTVGNIGSQKKMDYTVIGDMVNVASRLEGLTKVFQEPVIISESMYQNVSDKLPCRLLCRVAVKGRLQGTGLFAPRRSLSPQEEEAWKLHLEGLQLFSRAEFEPALKSFQKVQELLPGDMASRMLSVYCMRYKDSEAPEDWNGVLVMETK